MSRRLISILVLTAMGFLSATEFWLEPKKFHFRVGEEMMIDFREGESFTGELWDMKKNQVELLQWYSNSGVKDLS